MSKTATGYWAPPGPGWGQRPPDRTRGWPCSPTQMVGRGADHLKACCVFAAHMAERHVPDVVGDANGSPIDPATAKQIIAEHWTVPAEVQSRHAAARASR